MLVLNISCSETVHRNLWLTLVSLALEDFALVYMAHSCCNPFDIPGHSWSSRTKNLRPVTAWMYERAPQISIGSRICDSCRKNLSKEPPYLNPEPDFPGSEPGLYVHSPEAVASLLADIGETPYSLTKARGKKY